jgi:hypothetical protein
MVANPKPEIALTFAVTDSRDPFRAFLELPGSLLR